MTPLRRLTCELAQEFALKLTQEEAQELAQEVAHEAAQEEAQEEARAWAIQNLSWFIMLKVTGCISPI